MLDTLMTEARTALRALRAQPATTLFLVATLGLGIGANTAIFSTINGAYLNPLAYENPERTVYIGETRESDGARTPLSYGNALDLKEQASTIEALGLFVSNSVAVTEEDGRPERIRGLFVDADYFRVVGAQPELGRTISPGEDEPGGEPVAVLSHGFWETRFGGRDDVLGRQIVLNNRPHRIVGVMPRDFRPFWDQASAWISLHSAPRDLTPENRGSKDFSAMALLRDGIGIEQVEDELGRLTAGLVEAYPEGNRGWSFYHRPMLDIIRSAQGSLLAILAAAVGLVLLVTCANLANMQLVRMSGRRREMAIRAALGGSHRRILLGSLGENVLVGLLGGAVGLGVAVLGVDLLARLDPRYGTLYDIRPDGLVLGFTLALSVATGIAFGLAPALRAVRHDGVEMLKDGSRGGTGRRRSRRFKSGLVVAQIAMTVMLLAGSGLLLESMRNLTSVDVGFETDSLLTGEFRLTGDEYDSAEEQMAFFQRLEPRLNAIPGVEAAASVHAFPFSGNGSTQRIIEEGRPTEDPTGYPLAARNEVSPTYFRAMGIPLLAGRTFENGDRPGSPVVAVVSEALVDRAWGGESPIGRRVHVDAGGPLATVVGVVGNVRRSLSGPFDAEIYYSVYQVPDDFVGLAVRTSGDPMSLANALREAIWSIEPDQPVWEVQPATQLVGGTVARERFFTSLLSIFAVSGLLLASVGIYGVLGHSVGQRTREIGVRVALGASRDRVVRMVLGQGVVLCGIGLILGVIGALAGSRVLESSLFGVDPVEPSILASVCGLVLGATLLSSYLPARKAAHLDPARTIQAD